MATLGLHWPSIACQPDLFELWSVMDRSGRGTRTVEEVCRVGRQDGDGNGEGKGRKVTVVRELREVLDDPEVELVCS